MHSVFKRPIRPRQMNLGGEPGVLARRSRKKPGRHFEALMGGELLTTVEAAVYMRISRHTLRYWRTRGSLSGPRYLKVHAHRVLYRLADLEAYLESRLVGPVHEARRTK
jgi:hypothetical protein